jgi:hypothetical protein
MEENVMENHGTAPSPGARFARAIAAQDPVALRACLAEGLDFEALTPGRHWQAGTPGAVADEIVLGLWFPAGAAEVKQLRSVVEGRVAGRNHEAYLMAVRRDGADHLVEQQAYYDAEGGRITWMRVLCSGYQPAPEEVAVPV